MKEFLSTTENEMLRETEKKKKIEQNYGMFERVS